MPRPSGARAAMSRPALVWADGSYAADEYSEEGEVSEVEMYDESEVVDLVRERANAGANSVGDEALARALASQRSERTCVAQRRAAHGSDSDDDTVGDTAAARGGDGSACGSGSGSAGAGAAGKRPLAAPRSGRPLGRASAESGARPSKQSRLDATPRHDGGGSSRDGESSARPAEASAEAEGREAGDGSAPRTWAEAEAGANESGDEGEGEEAEGAHVPGLTVPRRLWRRMFEHQRMCLQWLWELHQQEVGGILGDEMGLGKTLQVIALLASLQASGRAGPALVVCPATVLLQWRREIERFAPEISPVEVLHHSQGGADPGNRLALLRSVCSPRGGRPEGACSVCVTSYEMVRSHASQLLRQPWQYVVRRRAARDARPRRPRPPAPSLRQVLDEGHKIRNPHAEITQVCKQFNTAHRLILSGAPIQNKLTELWSLFDFVFPGKLGTLPTFEEHFALPIAMGTYANASEFKARESGREWPRVAGMSRTCTCACTCLWHAA